MAGINLSQLNIPKSDEPAKRKHVVRLDELSDAYSNPDKKKETFNKEPVKKGELKKPESKIENIDKQLEKVQQRTEELLLKAKFAEEKSIAKAQPNHSQTIVKPSSNRSLKKRTEPTYIDYLLMKGIKKLILEEVEKNIYEENGEYYSFLDTQEIITDSSANIIRDSIYKLKKDNWFEILDQHYTKRFIKVEIKKYRK